jgi:hypothetical protein
MLIRVGYDIRFEVPAPVSIVGMLHVHPSRAGDLREPDEVRVTPGAPARSYTDAFGNRCSRMVVPGGSCSGLFHAS